MPKMHWFLPDQNFLENHSFIDYVSKASNDIVFCKNKETQTGQKKYHSHWFHETFKKTTYKSKSNHLGNCCYYKKLENAPLYFSVDVK